MFLCENISKFVPPKNFFFYPVKDFIGKEVKLSIDYHKTFVKHRFSYIRVMFSIIRVFNAFIDELDNVIKYQVISDYCFSELEKEQ